MCDEKRKVEEGEGKRRVKIDEEELQCEAISFNR